MCIFIFQIKAEIALLFRDHTNLLEEFWEYFKQIYPQVHENMEKTQDLEESEPSQPIRNVLPDKNLEPVKTSIKHRRKSNKHAQVLLLLSYSNSVLFFTGVSDFFLFY